MLRNTVPFFGICFRDAIGLRWVRSNVVGLDKAHSTETDPKTPHNIIDLRAIKKM